MSQVTAAEAEICSVAGGTDGNDVGMCYITMRLNRNRGNLKPLTVRVSRSDLMRLVEDGQHLLDNSPSLNTPQTLEACEDYVDVTSLPQKNDAPYQDSPIDGNNDSGKRV